MVARTRRRSREGTVGRALLRRGAVPVTSLVSTEGRGPAGVIADVCGRVWPRIYVHVIERPRAWVPVCTTVRNMWTRTSTHKCLRMHPRHERVSEWRFYRNSHKCIHVRSAHLSASVRDECVSLYPCGYPYRYICECPCRSLREQERFPTPSLFRGLNLDSVLDHT